MRRDQIARQEPILSGNLSPADLPNPHQPVLSEGSQNDISAWSSLQPQVSPYPINNLNSDTEPRVSSYRHPQ
jgi:hypothetical protein